MQTVSFCCPKEIPNNAKEDLEGRRYYLDKEGSSQNGKGEKRLLYSYKQGKILSRFEDTQEYIMHN